MIIMITNAKVREYPAKKRADIITMMVLMMMLKMMIITSANVREYPAKRAAAVREIAPGSAVSCNSRFHHRCHCFNDHFDDYVDGDHRHCLDVHFGHDHFDDYLGHDHFDQDVGFDDNVQDIRNSDCSANILLVQLS